MSETIVNVTSPPTPAPGEVGREFAAAFDRFGADLIGAARSARDLAAVIRLAEAIADFASSPRQLLGWTRRKWARERRRWNAETRAERGRYPRRIATATPGDEAAVMEMLRNLSSNWRAVYVPEPLPRPRSFAEYVERCVMDGRVPGRRA